VSGQKHQFIIVVSLRSWWCCRWWWKWRQWWGHGGW